MNISADPAGRMLLQLTNDPDTEPMMSTVPNYVLGGFALAYVLFINVLATAIMLRIYICRKQLGVVYQVRVHGCMHIHMAQTAWGGIPDACA